MDEEISVALAEHKGLGRIRLCECGSVHLSIGPVTVNLEPTAFLQAAAMVRKAAEQFEAMSDPAKRFESSGIFRAPVNHLTH